MRLTDLSVKALSVETGQRTFFDDTLPGFGIRCSPTVKAWVVMLGRNRSRTTLGRYPVVSLADARAEAKRLLAEHTLGKRRPQRMSFAAAFQLYEESHLKANNRERTAKETARIIRHDFLPSLQFHQLADIQTHEITKVTDRLLSQGKPGAANHAHAAIRGMLRFCVKRRLIAHSPLEGMGLPSPNPKTRERTLTDDELQAIWKAAEAIGYPFGDMVRLLMLTGQRRGEIAALRHPWINEQDKTITLPERITKNRREHEFPYEGMAVEILATIPKRNSTDLLFPSRRSDDKPLSGWSKFKLNLNDGVESWTLHDLRRTMSTRMAKLGVAPHVVERLLNHTTSQELSALARIYNRHRYIEEMREGVRLWQSELAKIIADS